jgi:uncharacterized repeat protein (TIGR01451 family)
MNKRTPWLGLLFISSALLATPVMAQVTTNSTPTAPTGFWLTTPFPELTLPAGQSGDIPLTLKNTGLPPQRAELSVTGLPTGWSSKLTGDGNDVTAVMVGDNDSEDVTLDLTPPKGATSGTYKFEVDAKYGGSTTTLPISVTLSSQKPGGLKLEPELPALQGSPTTSFDYQVKITNNSAKDELFNLSAKVPDGFTTSFKHGYGTAEITGVPIKAGANDTITLEVKPNPSVTAGKYPVELDVSGGGLSASAPLSLQITGSPTLSLTGPDQRLSGEASAGQATTFPFTVTNTGSAPAQDVKMSASAPTDWTVTFDPATIPSLAPNATQNVNVSITPSDKAIAGDYVANISANGQGVSQSEEFRVTVNTSTIWGIVGLIVIAVAVIILVLAVLRYGRR